MGKLKRFLDRVLFGITPEMWNEFNKAAERPVVFDDDVPELTEKELAEFKSVYPRKQPNKEKRREHTNIGYAVDGVPAAASLTAPPSANLL